MHAVALLEFAYFPAGHMLHSDVLVLAKPGRHIQLVNLEFDTEFKWHLVGISEPNGQKLFSGHCMHIESAVALHFRAVYLPAGHWVHNMQFEFETYVPGIHLQSFKLLDPFGETEFTGQGIMVPFPGQYMFS